MPVRENTGPRTSDRAMPAGSSGAAAARIARALNSGEDSRVIADLWATFLDKEDGKIPENMDEDSWDEDSWDEDSWENDDVNVRLRAEPDAEEPMDLEEDFDDNDMPLVIPEPQIEGLEWTSDDSKEEERAIEHFARCKCASGNCLRKFEASFVMELRAQMKDGAMTLREKKMFLMGKISASIHTESTTRCTKRTQQKERVRPRTTYWVEGQQICRDTFRFMHDVGDVQLRNITIGYRKNGVVPQSKGSGGRTKLAFSVEDIRRTVNYLTNYSDVNGLVIPGRISGVKNSDPRVRLLPCCDTKVSVWRKYQADSAIENDRRKAKAACTGACSAFQEGTNTILAIIRRAFQFEGLQPFRVFMKTAFLNTWQKYCPYIITTRPRTDLCWQCQQNNSAVYMSANLTEAEKLSRVETQEKHLVHVSAERGLYRQMVQNAKEEMEQGCREMHYSFDFAQQVHYPYDPDQPGPMYFLCPRKCGVFGVSCDGNGQQTNYLVDEGMCGGKGSNSVISYLHDYFLNFSLGEDVAHLHCDNCGGQNKNRYMMWYMAWRTICGLHDEISINFMVSGHTKFAPDRGFGLIKHLYKRSFVSSLQDLSDVVQNSSQCGCNIPRLVGLEDGTVIVPTYNWQTFLSPYFKSFPGIKKYHHMRFDRVHPGVVFVKVLPTDEEISFQLLRDVNTLPPRQLPDPTPPPGLIAARSAYLYRQIREFCTAATRDIVCPLTASTPEETEGNASDSDSDGEK